ncbi:hypothetical protein FKW77_009439 [Venturia effusa]|uniref:Uncharacterized protein n=1 Tax=Venturia effusa TaxID=50376 RepID=A0A517L1Z1_9PEZI|nr:hypothetical protein FKW77_009439 [Venturia effusa]
MADILEASETIATSLWTTPFPQMLSQHLAPCQKSSPPPPPTTPPPSFFAHKIQQSKAHRAQRSPPTIPSVEALVQHNTEATRHPLQNLQLEVLPLRQDAFTDADPKHQEQFLVAGETVALLREIARLRNKNFAKRLEIKNELTDLDYKRQRAAEAQENFIAASQERMLAWEVGGLDQHSQQLLLYKAWDELKSSTRIVKTREEWLKSAQDDVLKLEAQLLVKEDDLYDKFRALTRDASSSADSSTAISFTSDSSTSTAPIARKYYNRVGELNLLRDRFFNFVSEHRKQEHLRAIERKETRADVFSQRVLDQAFLREKQHMIQDYVVTKKEMEHIMEECERHGIEVAPPNLPPFLDHSLNKERVSDDGLGSDFPEKDMTPLQDVVLEWMQGCRNALAKNFAWEESSRTICDHTTPTSESPDASVWADHDTEECLTLLIHVNLHPTVSDDSATGTDVPESANGGKSFFKIDAEAFQGEAPSRRYSAPASFLESVAPIRLRKGLLQRKGQDSFAVLPRASKLGFSNESLP